jgi:hypothetical protein
LSKPQRKGMKISAGRPPRVPVHLKKEELSRVDELRINIIANRSQSSRPDVESTLELMYLRILGRVEDRGAVQKELKQLKSLLDQAAGVMTEIMDKTDKKPRGSK